MYLVVVKDKQNRGWNHTYLDILIRYLKERLKSYNHIGWEYKEGGDSLVVIVALAHHDPETNVREFTKDINPSYLVIKHRSSGNVPLDEMLETAFSFRLPSLLPLCLVLPSVTTAPAMCISTREKI